MINKWAPFNSILNGNEEKKKLENNKRKTKPILSDEQIDEIENKIIEAFTEQINITIIYFKKYEFYKVTGIITKINSSKKMITLNNNEIIYFNSIVKIL